MKTANVILVITTTVIVAGDVGFYDERLPVRSHSVRVIPLLPQRAEETLYHNQVQRQR